MIGTLAWSTWSPAPTHDVGCDFASHMEHAVPTEPEAVAARPFGNAR
jgi:hypothetical protein